MADNVSEPAFGAFVALDWADQKPLLSKLAF